MTDEVLFNQFWRSKSRLGLDDIDKQICLAGFIAGRASRRSEAKTVPQPLTDEESCEFRWSCACYDRAGKQVSSCIRKALARYEQRQYIEDWKAMLANALSPKAGT